MAARWSTWRARVRFRPRRYGRSAGDLLWSDTAAPSSIAWPVTGLLHGPDRQISENGRMAFRDVRIVGDPVLRTRCEEITAIDHTVRSLVHDLLDTVD